MEYEASIEDNVRHIRYLERKKVSRRKLMEAKIEIMWKYYSDKVDE